MTEPASHGVEATFVIEVRLPGADAEEHRFRGETLEVGAAPENDLVVDAPGVGARHLRVRPAGREFLVTDLGQGEGTLLGGSRLGAGEEYRLREGQEVRIGRASLTFETVLDVDVVEVDGDSASGGRGGRVLVGAEHWKRAEWVGTGSAEHGTADVGGDSARAPRRRAAPISWRAESSSAGAFPPLGGGSDRVPTMVRVLQVVGGAIFVSAVIFAIVLALL